MIFNVPLWYIPCDWLAWLVEFKPECSCCDSLLLLLARRGTLSEMFRIKGQSGLAERWRAMTWSPYSHSLSTVSHHKHLTSESGKKIEKYEKKKWKNRKMQAGYPQAIWLKSRCGFNNWVYLTISRLLDNTKCHLL